MTSLISLRLKPDQTATETPVEENQQAQPKKNLPLSLKLKSEQEFQPEQKESPEDQYRRESEMIWEDSGDMERQIERGQAQGTARLLESTLGTPGNIQTAIKGITGLQIGTQLPTSEDIKQFGEKASLGYTKPQNEFEKKAGEIVSDIGAMALPGGTGYSLMRNIGIPLTGFLAKEGLKKIGAGEQGSNAAKTAVMIALDLISAYKSKGAGGARNYASELWKEAESNVPKGAVLKAEDFSKELTSLKENLLKGGSSPSIGPAVTKVNELLKASKKGEIGIDDLMAFRVKINELIESKGGFKYGTDYKTQEKAIKKLNEVKDKVISKLDEYAQQNPKFGIPYKESNEAYSVYHTSNSIKNFLKSKFSDYLKYPALQYLFNTGLNVAGASLAGATYPIYQGAKILYRVVNSPTLARLYGRVLKGAAENNANVTAKNLAALKKELKKEDSVQEKNIQ